MARVRGGDDVRGETKNTDAKYLIVYYEVNDVIHRPDQSGPAITAKRHPPQSIESKSNRT